MGGHRVAFGVAFGVGGCEDLGGSPLPITGAEPPRQCLPAVLPVGGKRGFAAAAVRVSFAGRTVGVGDVLGGGGSHPAWCWVWGGGVGGWGGADGFCPPQLCTRVMPPDANPAWNEVFFFPLRVR